MEFQTYDELLNSKNLIDITYDDLLLTQEWRRKRKEIISRDCTKCKKCGKTSTYAHYDLASNKNIHIMILPNTIRYNVQNEIVHDIEIYEKPYYLHVHHKYYILNKLPWEYKNDALLTLCQSCHMDVHKNNHIPVYSQNGDQLMELETCGRCCGTGSLPQFKHVKNGVCFECNGNRYTQSIFKFDI